LKNTRTCKLQTQTYWIYVSFLPGSRQLTRMSPRYHIPVLETSNESRIIAHKLHPFLLHNTSLVLVSPKVHALFVPWKNRPETNTPLPTSLLITELDTLIKNGQEKDEGVTLTRTSDNPTSRHAYWGARRVTGRWAEACSDVTNPRTSFRLSRR